MAQNGSLISVLTGAQVIRDAALGATSDSDVGPGAQRLYLMQVDNTGNAAQKVYLKIYNSAGPTIGTTAPDIIIPIPGGSIQKVAVPEGISFGTGISMACVTGAGTAGVTGPTNPVIVALTMTAGA